MDFNEHTYDKIQRYLDKDLNADELRAFEAELQSNAELVSEVALHREMEDFLGDSEENELRKNLQTLGNQFSENPAPKSKNGSKYFLWLLPLLLLGGVLFYWNYANNDAETPIVPTEDEKKDSVSAPLIYANLPPFDSTLIDWEPLYPSISAVLSAPSIFDGDIFAPNRQLDSLMAYNFKQDSFKIIFEKHPSDTVWLDADGNILEGNVDFVATIQTPKDLIEKTVFFRFYNNRYEEWGGDFNFLKPYKSNEKELINLYRIDNKIRDYGTGLHYYVLTGVNYVCKVVFKMRPTILNSSPTKIKEKKSRIIQKVEPKDTLIYAQDTATTPRIEPGFIPPIFDDREYSSVPVYVDTFEPNPALELLVENSTRSDDFAVTVAVLTANFELESAEEPVVFRFSGTVKSADNLLEKQYQLLLFSNEVAAFQNFKPLETDGFVLTQSGEDYDFDFQKNYQLQSGLYYFVVEDIATERMVFVEKLVVQ